MILWRIPIAAAASAAIAVLAWRMRALSPTGAMAAFVVGVAAYGFGGEAVAVPVLVFFATGSGLSQIKNPRAVQARRFAAKGSTRDAAQVLANGGAAAACAIVSALFAPAFPDRSLQWLAAAVGALAVAAADTWATELGAMSWTPPRSIATLRRVQPGVSGGVTPLGFAASLAGGALIGVSAAFLAPQLAPWKWICLGMFVGFTGSALDSLLGATVQGVWRCSGCGEACEGPTHRCGASATHVSGWRLITNDFVNVIATSAGALLAGVTVPLIR